MNVYLKYAIYYFIGFLLTFASWLAIGLYIIFKKLSAFILINFGVVTICLIFFMACCFYYVIQALNEAKKNRR